MPLSARGRISKMIPQKIKVIKRFQYSHYPFCWIEKGEIGSYFKHAEGYIFSARDTELGRFVPYVDGKIALKRLDWWFEILNEEN